MQNIQQDKDFIMIWLVREHSGSVVECLTQRPRDHGLEPHWLHYVVSLSKTHLSLLRSG